MGRASSASERTKPPAWVDAQRHRTAPGQHIAQARPQLAAPGTVRLVERGLARHIAVVVAQMVLHMAPHRRGVVHGRNAFATQELRIAQAQLVGWLEGLFHGIQTTLFAQQMSARAQFEEMRRQAISAGQNAGMEDGFVGGATEHGPYL